MSKLENDFTGLELNDIPSNDNQQIVIIDDSVIPGDDIQINVPPTETIDVPRLDHRRSSRRLDSVPRHIPRKHKSNSSRSCCIAGFSMLQEAAKSHLIPNNFPHLGSENVKLKFLSYNLFIRPPGIMNNSNDYKDERITEFLREMVNFDIIGLQEVFSSFSSRQYDFIKKAYNLGFYYYIRSPKPYRSWSLVDGGLLLLSKYPIEDKDYLTYTLAMQSDALSAKGVLYAKLQITAHEEASVHVFLTHTQAAYANSDMARNQLVRKSQLIELRDFLLKKTSNDNQPVVVLGDLNVNARKSPDSGSDSEEYLSMMDVFRSVGDKYVVRDLLKDKYSYHPVTFADTWTDAGKIFPRETQLTDHSELCTMQRLDYIVYFEPRVQNLEHRFSIESSRVMPFFVEKRPFTQISDHYGVESVIQYRYSRDGNGSSSFRK